MNRIKRIETFLKEYKTKTPYLQSICKESYEHYIKELSKEWVRKDEELNLNPTLESFDSEAIMYGCPFEINGELYLFYNGNNFGEKGFAIATLSKE